MEQTLDLYTRLVQEGKSQCGPRRGISRATLLGVLLFFYLPAMLVLFFVGVFHSAALVIIAVVGLGTPIFVIAGMMWFAMVLRFSPHPIPRIFFGAFTLMLFGTGIGWFANLLLFLWVMDSKRDIFTGEPLAQGPKRDAWLAQRRPQTNVMIDARQVHVHR